MLRSAAKPQPKEQAQKKPNHYEICFPLFSAAPQAGGLKEISRWLTERDSAKMASPQAMARSKGWP
jgi:hypothetical protein